MNNNKLTKVRKKRKATEIPKVVLKQPEGTSFDLVYHQDILKIVNNNQYWHDLLFRMKEKLDEMIQYTYAKYHQYNIRYTLYNDEWIK